MFAFYRSSFQAAIRIYQRRRGKDKSCKKFRGKNKFPVVMSAPRQFDSPYNKNSTIQK